MAYAYYTEARGGRMRSIEQHWSRSDTVDRAYYRESGDYGRTWSAPVEHSTREERPDGTLRRHPRGGWIEPGTGRYLEFWMEGILPNDDPLEGLRRWSIFYRAGMKGKPVQLVHQGREFSADHPLPEVHVGKNCAMIGDNASQPYGYRGRILLPVEVTIGGADGKLFNPGGGYTWHDSAVLHGTWTRGGIAWRMSDRIAGDPERTTRGAIEPTIGELDDGRLILVMRGSNDRRPSLPSYRWVSYSVDGGFRWTKPEPWAYESGEPFFSPSACSQLLRHSSGRLYWLGNITGANPKGNRPRYPFCVGEVDRRSGALRRKSVRVIDDLGPGENPLLTLSNFYAREDRQTREIAVHMTRLFALPDGWEGDAMLYRIRV